MCYITLPLITPCIHLGNEDTGCGLHGGVAVSTVTSQQEGYWIESQLGAFCVEFVCVPFACVGSLHLLQSPPTIQKHAC